MIFGITGCVNTLINIWLLLKQGEFLNQSVPNKNLSLTRKYSMK